MMLIDREEAIKELTKAQHSADYCREHRIDSCIDLGMICIVLYRLSSVQQTQEIVHCENCEHWDTSWETVHGLHYCPMIDLSTKKDFFCKYGIEKRGETK